METIKNYLETMFANMPNTEAVRKAKDELLQMMEDKYTELIDEGMSENTAIGTVISEFGNLEDLKEELGLVEEVRVEAEYVEKNPRRFISFEEAKNYADTKAKCGLLVALGVAMCITCVCFPVGWENEFGVTGMFVWIAIAVGLFVFSGVIGSDWKFVKNQNCQVDMATADYFADERRKYKNVHALRMTIGISLLVVCWVPFVMINELEFMEILATIAMFVLIAIGVFLIVYSSHIMGSYETILKLNDKTTISGSYGKNNECVYSNKKLATIMSVYWPTVTCIYFIWSFLTFHWYISWIIWPIAAVFNKIIEINFAD